MRKSIFILTSILVFLICSCNSDQHYKFVKGTVYSSNGTPLANVKVTIGSEITKTDSAGRYACPVHARNNWCNAKFQHNDYVTIYSSLSELEKRHNIYLPKRKDSYTGESSTQCVFYSKHSRSLMPNTTFSQIKVLEDLSVTIPANSLADKKGNPYKGKYEIHIDALPNDSNFRGILPGGKTLNCKGIKSVESVNIEIQSPAGDELAIRPGYFVKLYVGAKSTWRYDEKFNCWVINDEEDSTDSCIDVSQTGWFLLNPPTTNVDEFRTTILDSLQRPVPYAELQVKTDDFEGTITSTKEGEVLFYYIDSVNVVLKGYHTAEPSNRYPFVDEDVYTSLEDVKISNTTTNVIKTLSVNNQLFNYDEVLPENEETVYGCKYLILGRAGTTAKPYESPNVEDCRLDSNGLIKVTLEELGYGRIKEINKGTYDFWEDAHITFSNGWCTTIKSNDYEDICAQIEFDDFIATLYAADSTLYTDWKGITRCRINALYFKIIKECDGFEIHPRLTYITSKKTYTTGADKKLYCKQPITCSINYVGKSNHRIDLIDMPTEKIDPDYNVSISVSIPIVRHSGTISYREERDGHKLNIYRLTDGYGRNAFAHVKDDNIKKEALLTGELNFEFYGRDSIYNQTVKFRKYEENDFKTGIGVSPIIIILIISIIILVALKASSESKETKETKMQQCKIIACVLRLNPTFTDRQRKLITKYGLPNNALSIIEKGMSSNSEFEDIDFSLLESIFDLSKRRNFVNLLFKLAAEDDGIKNDEWALLYSIMKKLGLNNPNIEYMQRRYSPLRSEYDDYSKYYKSRNENEHTTHTSSTNANASDYAELGLVYGATKEEVQQAYHKLAMEYHPDLPKNANRHEECVRRMAAINVAYKHLIN